MKEQLITIDEFKKKGFRITKIRKALVDVFNEITNPISVPELLGKLKEQEISPDKATVYREIDFLINQKAIKEIDFCDGKKRYESAYMDHHHHLVCTGCNVVMDVNLSDKFEREIQNISKNNNFQIDEHLLEFFGKCSKCKK